jgi:predicted amidohydrolase YtcJ
MNAATVYVNGRVLTLEAGVAPCEALGVCDGRVVARGAAGDVRRTVGKGAEEVDLRGGTLMPGIVDTHPHVVHFGLIEGPLVDLKDATSHADIVARIAARARTTPKGEWIMCSPIGEPHYFLRRSWRDLAEGRLPDRHVLDRATTDHPVWIQAWAPVIPNVCAFNTAGLARLELGRETPSQIEHVWIEKDAHGEPTGILRGSVTNYYTGDRFMNRLLCQLPLLQVSDVPAAMARAMNAYNRLGVTTVYEGHVMDAALIGLCRELRAADALTLRILAAPEAERYAMPWDPAVPDLAEFRARLAEAGTLVDRTDDLLRVDGVTISRGGPCWPGFILMRDPYRGPYGDLTRGVSFIPLEWCEIAMRHCAEHGLRLNVVVAGTGEHDEYLAQLEAVDRDFGIRDRHWILQHVFFLEPEQARRYAALGFDVTASMSFSWGKGDMFIERIGEHVLQHLIPLRRMLDAGMTVAGGTDWGPKNVFEHVALATTHEFCGSGRRNDGPAQKVGRAEALAMWTRDAARVLRWDDVGTLAPGNHADLIVVDRDPMTAAVEDLPATRVLRTVLGGRVVHDTGAL